MEEMHTNKFNLGKAFFNFLENIRNRFDYRFLEKYMERTAGTVHSLNRSKQMRGEENAVLLRYEKTVGAETWKISSNSGGMIAHVLCRCYNKIKLEPLWRESLCRKKQK